MYKKAVKRRRSGFTFCKTPTRGGCTQTLVVAEFKRLFLDTFSSDFEDLNHIASVDVALARRRETILDELHTLFDRQRGLWQ